MRKSWRILVPLVVNITMKFKSHWKLWILGCNLDTTAVSSSVTKYVNLLKKVSYFTHIAHLEPAENSLHQCLGGTPLSACFVKHQIRTGQPAHNTWVSDVPVHVPRRVSFLLGTTQVITKININIRCFSSTRYSRVCKSWSNNWHQTPNHISHVHTLSFVGFKKFCTCEITMMMSKCSWYRYLLNLISLHLTVGRIPASCTSHHVEMDFQE